MCLFHSAKLSSALHNHFLHLPLHTESCLSQYNKLPPIAKLLKIPTQWPAIFSLTPYVLTMTASAKVATRPAMTATPRLFLSRSTRPNVKISIPFCTLRAAMAATSAFLVFRSTSSVGSVVADVVLERFDDVDEVATVVSMGSP